MPFLYPLKVLSRIFVFICDTKTRAYIDPSYGRQFGPEVGLKFRMEWINRDK